MKILAIETSCDETAAAIVEGDAGGTRILAHTIYSQIDLHQQYGGVYPEAASREHLRKIGPIIIETLKEAVQSSMSNDQLLIPNKKVRNLKLEIRNLDLRRYLKEQIDYIAVTSGPGLIGSLLVGVNTAKALAYAMDKPLVGVNHHEGHVMAAWLRPENSKHETRNSKQIQNTKFETPQLPVLALIVSGGHTQLVLMKGYGEFELVGRTRDDAAGEAFDKVARLLGLPYPGGPAISALAEKNPNYKLPASRQGGQMSNKSQNPKSKTKDLDIRLPRPMLDSKDFHFSFSGLKTAVGRLVAEHQPLTDDMRAAIAYEFQEAVIDVLVTKTVEAAKVHNPASIVVCGGVAANKRLRTRMAEVVATLPNAPSLHIPTPLLCTDNAAMIGAAAVARLLANQVHHWYDVEANDRWQIGSEE